MTNIEEFWYCVSPQENLPLFKSEFLTSEQCEKLIAFLKKLKKHGFEDAKEITLKKMLVEEPNMLEDFRIITGVSDKRLYLDLSYIFNKTTFSDGTTIDERSKYDLIKHSTSFFINKLKSSSYKNEIADTIIDYFLEKNLLEIIDTFIGMDDNQIKVLYSALITPKETQQKEAKYRGHGAEMYLARAFNSCDIEFYPENKHIDPMETHDPNVNLKDLSIVAKNITNPYIHSFDLIVKRNKTTILIQSLIHSSDPGQYGVDKSNETKEIKKLINEYNSKNRGSKVYLWGLVDGVRIFRKPTRNYIEDAK